MAKAYKRLHQMNGDHLSKLKRPLCSEFSVGVKGTINAKNEEHHKKVSLLFKDRNFNINKIKRSQDEVYSTLLRVHKHKKIMQREKYKRMQEEARQSADSDYSQTLKSSKDSKVDKLVIKHMDKDSSGIVDAKQGKDMTSEQTNDITTQSKTNDSSLSPECNNKMSSTAVVKKSRVLEVQKDSVKPISRERTTYEPFPKISDTVIESRAVSDDQTSEIIHQPSSRESDSSKNSKKLAKNGDKRTKLNELKTKRINKPKMAPPTSYLLSVGKAQSPTMTAISEEKSQCQSSQHTQKESSFHKMVDDITEASQLRASWPLGLDSSSSKRKAFSTGTLSRGESVPSGDHLSMVEINKIRAKQQEAWRKEAIEKEPVYQFVLDEKGRVVRDIKDFHRKEFHPPSLKEKHFQHKMMLSQVDATLQQKLRIEDFFGQIEADMEKAEARKRALAKMASDAVALEEADEKKRRDQETIGVTLAVLTAAFNRVERLPSDVDPNSVEALKLCKYMREYKPLAMSKEERKEAKRHKVSSWAKPGPLSMD